MGLIAEVKLLLWNQKSAPLHSAYSSVLQIGLYLNRSVLWLVESCNNMTMLYITKRITFEMVILTYVLAAELHSPE